MLYTCCFQLEGNNFKWTLILQILVAVCQCDDTAIEFGRNQLQVIREADFFYFNCLSNISTSLG